MNKRKNALILKIAAFCLAILTILPFIVSCSGDKPADVTSESVTEEEKAPEEPKEYSLEGKTLFFLGSSVTYGSANNGVSFVEMIAKNNNCTCVKEAVSGTTLVNSGNDSGSYVARLVRKAKFQKKVDHFICQLSTNDATQNKPLGKVSDSKNMDDFDVTTIIGAMEYIIAFAKDKWNCHVSFYTGTKFDNALYQKMVDALYDLKEKWDIGIIDLWNDEEMNAVSDRDYRLYMSDPIHPTGKGYSEWWTPKFEAFLKQYE